MPARRIIVAVEVFAFLLATATAQTPKTDTTVADIVGATLTRSGAYVFLQTLSDSIGARVTGSSESHAASELIFHTLREAGLDNVHFEEYPLTSKWHRGPATAEIISPSHFKMTVGAYGWVPGTAGRVEATVYDAGSPQSAELAVSAEKVKGSAVIVDVHPLGRAPLQVMRTKIAQQLARMGAVAMLIPSDKPDRMVYTSAWGYYPRGPMPVLSVAKEDTAYLRRLLASGPVRMALDVRNSFDRDGATERNVVAEIPGSVPGEVVVVGAHLDSWDFAQGAEDDGAGVAALVEAARVLKSTGVKPRRTIRFVFFSGEEQADLGSRAYIAAHKSELDNHAAFLMMDGGSSMPVGFSASGRHDVAEAARALLKPLADVGVTTVDTDIDLESDNASFITAGIPTLALKVLPSDYEWRHHAVTDTFDKIDARSLAADTAVMAASAYLIANSATPVARRMTFREVEDLLRSADLYDAQLLQFGPLVAY